MSESRNMITPHAVHVTSSQVHAASVSSQMPITRGVGAVGANLGDLAPQRIVKGDAEGLDIPDHRHVLVSSLLKKKKKVKKVKKSKKK